MEFQQHFFQETSRRTSTHIKFSKGRKTEIVEQTA